MKNAVITVHDDDGIRTGLVTAVGPKFISVVWPDSSGIRIRKIGRDARYRVLDGYNLNKAKRHLRRCGRNFGITKAAKTALKN